MSIKPYKRLCKSRIKPYKDRINASVKDVLTDRSDDSNDGGNSLRMTRCNWGWQTWWGTSTNETRVRWCVGGTVDKVQTKRGCDWRWRFTSTYPYAYIPLCLYTLMPLCDGRWRFTSTPIPLYLYTRMLIYPYALMPLCDRRWRFTFHPAALI